MFRQVCCWEQSAPVGLWQIFPLSSKINIYPTGRIDTKIIKETSQEIFNERIKETWQTYRCIQKKMHFFCQTTFSTDVLQHEYIIYIFLYITFSRSEIHNGAIQREFFRL